MNVRLGITAERLSDDGTGVDVTFSDGTSGRYDIVIGADGVYSRTRVQIMPDAPTPRYTGQWVWRYNLAQARRYGLHPDLPRPARAPVSCRLARA